MPPTLASATLFDRHANRAAVLQAANLAAVSVCLVIGTALSIWPHLLWWGKTGDLAYVADYDDLCCYLPVAGQAYNTPLHLHDPVQPNGTSHFFPRLQFTSGILLAKLFALGPLRVNLAWRLLGGIATGLGTYFLLRRYVPSVGLAAGLAIFVMADIGQMWAQPLWRQVQVSIALLTGRDGDLFGAFPQLATQWRSFSPGLSWAFVLLHLIVFAWARESPTPFRCLWSGLTFGLVFYVYFYYWTALACALVLGFLLDAGRRRLYLITGLVGEAVGFPDVLDKYLTKQAFADDWQQRTDHIVHIARTSELLVPRAAVVLLCLAVFFVWTRRRDLIYLWSLAAAGLALANHQLITGRQIQNFHWHFVWGPATFLLAVLLGAGWVQPYLSRRWVRAALVLVAAIHLGAGFGLRSAEALWTRQSCEIMEDYDRYRQQAAEPGKEPLEPHTLIAGDPAFVNLAVIAADVRPLDHYLVLFSFPVSNDDWDSRIALNGFLRGQDRPAFLEEQTQLLAGSIWGPWARDPELRDGRLANRLAHYDRAAQRRQRPSRPTVSITSHSPWSRRRRSTWMTAGGSFRRDRTGVSGERDEPFSRELQASAGMTSARLKLAAKRGP